MVMIYVQHIHLYSQSYTRKELQLHNTKIKLHNTYIRCVTTASPATKGMNQTTQTSKHSDNHTQHGIH